MRSLILLLLSFYLCFPVYAETNNSNAASMKSLIEKAKNGDAESQFLLGGLLLSSNEDQAEHWLLKASENGHEEAQVYLGLQYYTGDHFEKDSTSSAKWFSKAAEKNNATAQYWLALHYADGEGVEQDIGKTVELLKNAAQQGLIKAQTKLGQMYYLGNVVSQNHQLAFIWLNKAAEQEDVIAQFYLGLLYEGQKEYEHAVKWHKKAAMKGDPDAQLMLGLKYAQGLGVPKDQNKAYAWITLAADKGVEDARQAQKMIVTDLSDEDFTQAKALYHEYQKSYRIP